MKIVFHRALLKVSGDKPYTNFDEVLMDKKDILEKDAKIGDWGYFENHEDYEFSRLGASDSYRGENVINVGPDSFWGHPIGAHPSRFFRERLLADYNNGRGVTEKSKDLDKIKWHKDNVRFFDVSALARKSFANAKIEELLKE